MRVLQEAFELPVEGGECLCVYRRAAEVPLRGTVLHLPAFGDEMNKARAMTARAARAFAAAGFGVLQVDLLGCGDSSGDHRDATLARWVDNARRAREWLRAKCSGPVEWLWALRAGALLVPPLTAHEALGSPLLLWQPVLAGEHQLGYLLRQKLASELFGDARDRGGLRALRERLRGGEALEIGGYAISPALAEELERAAFEVPQANGRQIAWFEVTSSPAPALSPAAARRIESLRAVGARVTAAAIAGPGFWQSVEIERCDNLVEASIAALTSEQTHGAPRDAVAL